MGFDVAELSMEKGRSQKSPPPAAATRGHRRESCIRPQRRHNHDIGITGVDLCQWPTVCAHWRPAKMDGFERSSQHQVTIVGVENRATVTLFALLFQGRGCGTTVRERALPNPGPEILDTTNSTTATEMSSRHVFGVRDVLIRVPLREVVRMRTPIILPVSR